MTHRSHLFDLMKKKTLNIPNTRKVRKPSATLVQNTHGAFKVGYTGNVQDIYKQVPNTYLNQVKEENMRKRDKNRANFYKGLLKEHKMGTNVPEFVSH